MDGLSAGFTALMMAPIYSQLVPQALSLPPYPLLRFEFRLLRTLENGSSNRREVFAVKRRVAGDNINQTSPAVHEHVAEAVHMEPGAREAISSVLSASLTSQNGAKRKRTA